jgi:DNA-binding transcriptional MerR regulator
MNPNETTKKHYSIGAVSEMTGVNSVTLRAWERRYGLIQPERTPKGHRLYSREDINLIEAILEYLERGLSISKVADQIKQKVDQEEGPDTGDAWGGYLHRMIDAIGHFDEAVLDAIYNEAMSLYPVDVVTRKLIKPLLIELGERWLRSQGDPDQVPIAEEHFFSVFIRNKLGARFHHQNAQNTGPRLIAACLPGEHHEFGLLLFALSAHARGYRLVLLGSDMPLNELAIVAHRTDADGVVLSGSNRLTCMEFNAPLKALVNDLSLPVFIGGEVSERCGAEIGVTEAEIIGADLVDGLKRIKQVLNFNQD